MILHDLRPSGPTGKPRQVRRNFTLEVGSDRDCVATRLRRVWKSSTPSRGTAAFISPARNRWEGEIRGTTSPEGTAPQLRHNLDRARFGSAIHADADLEEFSLYCV